MFAKPISINENLEEMVPRNAAEFPIYACYDDFAMFADGRVPWHWHPDVEFSWVLQGNVQMSTNNHSEIIRAGEGAFFNSNVLHCKKACPGTAAIVLEQVLDAQILSGFSNSVFDRKYVAPVVECRDFEFVHFHPSDPAQRDILEHIRRSYDAAEREEEGYEFIVRNELSAAWLLLYREAAPLLGGRNAAAGQDEERIKRMMLFVQEHYAEKVTLEQIAAAANISGRECLRCFQRTLNTTPFTYLLEYRTRRAADKLRKSGASVTEVAYACGFSGASYFGKTFKRIMGCTPLEYRKRTHSSML